MSNDVRITNSSTTNVYVSFKGDLAYIRFSWIPRRVNPWDSSDFTTVRTVPLTRAELEAILAAWPKDDK